MKSGTRIIRWRWSTRLDVDARGIGMGIVRRWCVWCLYLWWAIDWTQDTLERSLSAFLILFECSNLILNDVRCKVNSRAGRQRHFNPDFPPCLFKSTSALRNTDPCAGAVYRGHDIAGSRPVSMGLGPPSPPETSKWPRHPRVYPKREGAPRARIWASVV